MTCKSVIIQFLEDTGESYKGKIEDYLRDVTGAMGDTVSRRLRELTKEGILLKGERDGHTTYRIAPRITLPPAYKPVSKQQTLL